MAGQTKSRVSKASTVSAGKRPTTKKKAATASAGKYTKPSLRERFKTEIQASDKGGRKGEWSARKSQLLTQAYEKHGGGYRGGKSASQKNLESWTEAKWQTKDGDARARHGKEIDRYLPAKAWEKLTPAEKKATDTKKRAASRKGKQMVANTAAAKTARKASIVKRSKA